MQQELELEDELIHENPELAEFIHEINTLETQALHRGFGSVFEAVKGQKGSVWVAFFDGAAVIKGGAIAL